MRSYLENRQQSVTVQGKLSREQEMKLGTPQGSRLSPLAFVCFMADLDLHVSENCQISQFADDTQTLCVAKNLETVKKNTITEANNVINYFSMKTVNVSSSFRQHNRNHKFLCREHLPCCSQATFTHLCECIRFICCIPCSYIIK